MNATYGATMGYFKSVNEWYNALIKETYNLGLNPWANSQPISKRYGIAEETVDKDGNVVKITDVPVEEWGVGGKTIHARSLFCGYAFVVTGGRNVDIYSPYCIAIENEVNPSNPRVYVNEVS